MDKKNIVIVINDLGLGGAERLLMGLLPAINERYNVILVTLIDKEVFDKNAIIACKEKYCLDFTNNFSIPKCIYKLTRIIKKHNPVLVHAHLFYSNIIARIACPASIPCLFTVHSLQSYDIFSKSRLWTFLEKSTVRPYHSIMVVSEHLLEDYELHIKKMQHSFVLPNCVEDIFFETIFPAKNYNGLDKLKLVAIGNIKPIKNYGYLIEAFKYLKDYPVTLDIYGTDQGELSSLQKIIDENQLPVTFKGRGYDINELLLNYDIYVMSSKSEGCSVAVIEAMTLGLPLLLSTLPGLKAETFGNALFFDIVDKQTFVARIKEIINKDYDLNMLSEKGMQIAKQHYTKSMYIQKLFSIYNKLQITRF